ncbi:MAG: DUF4175 domain-containing protein, partial [Paracoccaceae bacterium]|nr:DUF4175 domain-containing protein [Paracoccaceae bacterium]
MHKRLRLVVLLTRAGLAVERALKAFWPLGSIFLFVLSAIAFGLHDILPLAVLFAAGVLVIAALAVAVVLGFRRFSMPLGLDAVRWLDETATGAPLEALSDMPALGKSDPASIALWRLHQNRMAEAVRSLRPRAPSLQLAGLDPYGIRLIALWAVSLAIIFGAPARVLTLAEIMPGEGQSVIAQGPLWEGWVQPPSYTGKPGLYLADQSAQTFAVPAGSMVTIRLYGSPGKVAVHHDLGDELVENVEASVQKFEVMRSGQLKIEGPGGRSWDLAVIPDAPPEVALLGWPERGLSGEFTLRYAASDDYGVEKGEVAVSLALEQVKRVHGLSVEPEALPPVVGNLSLPVGGNLQDFQGEYRENLEKHPWAGLPVTLKASVVDAAGQTGTSQSKAITLPSRRFFDPLARALIEQRRDLLWSAENSLRVSQVLRAVIHRPEEFFDAQANYLTLSVAISRLEGGTLSDDPEIRDEVAEALWAIAIGIEDGNIADARARLEQAQKRLQQAMESGATEEELAELMQELRDAMKDFLQELAQQESQDNRRFSENSNVQELTQEQLDSLLSQLQELMEQGRMAEAEQLLDM